MFISREQIEKIFQDNVMSGRIETGHRIWVRDSWLNSGGNKQFDYLIEKARNTEGAPPLAPIEKTRAELNQRISEISDYLYKLQ